ncbi:MAG: hypothetical protein Q4B48_08585, partial [Syntrophomonadaceae bacterium]|nr:hypothetical protein [Syntrophomonadaceae bacterium]
MRTKTNKAGKLLALLLSLIMLAGLLPVSAFAAAGDSEITAIDVTAFPTALTVPNGTALGEITDLPTALSVTLTTPAETEGGEPTVSTESLPITWTCADYDGDTAGEYTL